MIFFIKSSNSSNLNIVNISLFIIKDMFIIRDRFNVPIFINNYNSTIRYVEILGTKNKRNIKINLKNILNFLIFISV